MAQMFLDRVAATPEREAFRFPRGDQWKSVSWRETEALTRRRAAGLIALGVEPEQRVAVASSTRIEWIQCYVAAVLAAAATTTIYPSTMLDRRGVHRRRCRRPGGVRRGRRAGRQAPPAPDGDAVAAQGRAARRDARGERRRLGDRARRARRARRRSTWPSTRRLSTIGLPGIKPDHLCTLDLHVRYDGTAEGRAAAALGVDVRGRRGRGDAGAQHRTTCSSCGCRCRTCSARCCSPYSSRSGSRPRSTAGSTRSSTNAAVVQPTFMAAAPRIFEKAHGRIVTMMEAEGGVEGQAVPLGLRSGRQGLGAAAAGQGAGRACWRRSTRLADKLVLSKIRARFGGRIRFFVSGSAALDK